MSFNLNPLFMEGRLVSGSICQTNLISLSNKSDRFVVRLLSLVFILLFKLFELRSKWVQIVGFVVKGGEFWVLCANKIFKSIQLEIN